MISKRKTKKQILTEAGYVPTTGRPLLYGEKTALVQFRIPESLANKLGKESKERNEVARGIMIEYLSKEEK